MHHWMAGLMTLLLIVTVSMFVPVFVLFFISVEWNGDPIKNRDLLYFCHKQLKFLLQMLVSRLSRINQNRVLYACAVCLYSACMLQFL